MAEELTKKYGSEMVKLAEERAALREKERESNPIAERIREYMDVFSAAKVKAHQDEAAERQRLANVPGGSPERFKSSVTELKSLLSKVYSGRDANHAGDRPTVSAVVEPATVTSNKPNSKIPPRSTKFSPKSVVTMKFQPTTAGQFNVLTQKHINGTDIKMVANPSSRSKDERGIISGFSVLKIPAAPGASAQVKDISKMLKETQKVFEEMTGENPDRHFSWLADVETDGNGQDSFVFKFFPRQEDADIATDIIKDFSQDLTQWEPMRHQFVSDFSKIFDHVCIRSEFEQDVGKRLGERESLVDLMNSSRVVVDAVGSMEWRRLIFGEVFFRWINTSRYSLRKKMTMGLTVLTLPLLFKSANVHFQYKAPEMSIAEGFSGFINKATKVNLDGELEACEYAHAYGKTAFAEWFIRTITFVFPIGLTGRRLTDFLYHRLLKAPLSDDMDPFGLHHVVYLMKKCLVDDHKTLRLVGKTVGMEMQVDGMNVIQHFPSSYEAIRDHIRVIKMSCDLKDAKASEEEKKGAESDSSDQSGSDEDEDEGRGQQKWPFQKMRKLMKKDKDLVSEWKNKFGTKGFRSKKERARENVEKEQFDCIFGNKVNSHFGVLSMNIVPRRSVVHIVVAGMKGVGKKTLIRHWSNAPNWPVLTREQKDESGVVTSRFQFGDKNVEVVMLKDLDAAPNFLYGSDCLVYLFTNDAECKEKNEDWEGLEGKLNEPNEEEVLVVGNSKEESKKVPILLVSSHCSGGPLGNEEYQAALGTQFAGNPNDKANFSDPKDKQGALSILEKAMSMVKEDDPNGLRKGKDCAGPWDF